MLRIGTSPRDFDLAGRRVTLGRTAEGVMRIAAGDDIDLACGVGFAHAHDRMLQMEMVRLVGQGRLCECLKSSEETLAVDVFMRRMGFAASAREEAARFSGTSLELAGAYAQGVNARLVRGFPLELRLAGHRPSPWEPADTLLTLALMAYVGLLQTQQDAEKVIVQAVKAGVSLPKLRRLFGPHLDGLGPELVELLQRVRVEQPVVPPEVRLLATGLSASNNWAVSGRHTASGSPFLASDPHLEVNRLPAIWYEIVGELPGDYRMGVTVPGVPGLVMGRTRSLAATFTYGFMDSIDYFLEEVRGGACRRGEAWVPLSRRHEVIRRKGAAGVELTVLTSDAGTLETREGNDAPEDGLYLCRAWAGEREGAAGSLEALLSLWRAGNVPAAQVAAAPIAVSANWLLADRDGNVGYQQSGYLPRRRHSGLFPVPAWDPAFAWGGRVPPESLARHLNPGEGFLVTANDEWNPAAGPLAVNLSMGSYRVERIRELLAARLASGGKLTLDDMAAIQRDLVSGQARRFLEVLRPLLPDTPAGRLLEAWDCRYDASSRAAVLFERVYAALLSKVFGDGLFGCEAWEHLAGETSLLPMYFHVFDTVLLAEDGEEWFGAGGREALLSRVVSEVLADADPGTVPEWGEGRRVVMKQIFFDGALPRWLGFDVGPVTLEGGRATIVQGQVITLGGRQTTFCPSWRFLTDLGKDEAETALAGGPSDRRLSRHYATDIERWRTYRYKTLRAGDSPGGWAAGRKVF